MEYIVKVNGKEYGPIEEDILIRWVEDGRVLADSEVRNSKLNLWKRADSFAFLYESFRLQDSKFKKIRQPVSQKSESPVTQILQLSMDEKTKVESTEFKNSYLPQKAGIFLRMKAGFLDLAIIIGIFCICLYLGDFIMNFTSSANHLSKAMATLFLWIFLTLLYFGAMLGVFGQTIGMWYQGLIIVREGNDAEEVYLFRAFICAVFICLLWFLSPLFNYIIGKKRTLPDIITDTQIVLISSRKIEESS